jgi:pimeloyl-ACP methyl ester carboxylesterase
MGYRFSSEDERLLRASLPPLKTVRVQTPLYPSTEGVLEYRESGRRDRPAILCLHGIGSSSAGYAAQLAGLQQQYRVVAWNAPGFGNSTALAHEHPDADAYVECAIAMLRSLGINELSALVGSSWGSVVATAFARASVLPVRELVLSAPNIARGSDENTQVRDRARRSAIDLGLASFAQPRSAIADKLLAPNSPHVVREHTMRLRDAVTQHGWSQAMSMLFTVSTPHMLPEVAARVTIVVGTYDKVAPEATHARALQAARPDANYIRIEGVGHMPKLEAPATFNQLIDASVNTSVK